MTVIAWILLGLVAGIVGSRTMSNTDGGIVLEGARR